MRVPPQVGVYAKPTWASALAGGVGAGGTGLLSPTKAAAAARRASVGSNAAAAATGPAEGSGELAGAGDGGGWGGAGGGGAGGGAGVNPEQPRVAHLAHVALLGPCDYFGEDALPNGTHQVRVCVCGWGGG